MPGYIIHLTEAKLIFDMLKQNSDKGWNVFGDGDLEQWFREFSYGALLPDSSTRRGKVQSHFWSTEPRPCIVMTPQIARFLQEYDVSFGTPLLLGYLAHLDLDLKFWDVYMKSCVEFRDGNGEPAEDIRKVQSVFLKNTGRVVTLEEFFSPGYLYGDYGKLNRYLIGKYHLLIPEYEERYQGMVREVDNRDMEGILEDLKGYLEREKGLDSGLEVLSEELFERFVKETARRFVESIAQKIHIKNSLSSK